MLATTVLVQDFLDLSEDSISTNDQRVGKDQVPHVTYSQILHGQVEAVVLILWRKHLPLSAPVLISKC